MTLLLLLIVGSIGYTFAFISPISSRCQHFNVGVHNNRVAEPDQNPIAYSCSSTKLHLFGNLFGSSDEDDRENKELARYPNLLPGSEEKIDVKFDSLSIMISSWSKMLKDNGSGIGLTTAVDVVQLPTSDDSTGVQLLFKKGKGGRSAYSDKDEKDGEETKKKEEESVKEGGVQIMINKLPDNGNLEVVASRCEVEEGTMIKEMSEQTIVDSLGQVMKAWKKEQTS